MSGCVGSTAIHASATAAMAPAAPAVAAETLVSVSVTQSSGAVLVSERGNAASGAAAGWKS